MRRYCQSFLIEQAVARSVIVIIEFYPNLSGKHRPSIIVNYHTLVIMHYGSLSRVRLWLIISAKLWGGKIMGDNLTRAKLAHFSHR